jgi:hypothetical protein
MLLTNRYILNIMSLRKLYKVEFQGAFLPVNLNVDQGEGDC